MVERDRSVSQDGALWEQVRHAAYAWYDAGYNVIPLKSNGTKAPAKEWKQYRTERIPDGLHDEWFADRKWQGIAVVAGVAFDGALPVELFEPENRDIALAYREAADAAGLGGLLTRLQDGYLDLAPRGGYHILWRCAEVGPTQALAYGDEVIGKDGKPRRPVLIETRGRSRRSKDGQGLIIVAPSGGGAHPSGKPWKRLRGGLSTIVEVTLEERSALLALARTFDKAPPPEAPKGPGRPGDEYNERGPEIAELIEPAGWTLAREDGEVTYWTRPGKDPAEGVSASLGLVRDRDGDPMLHVFTSSAAPFEQDGNYSKFGVYAMLECDGDYKAAAKALRAEGYGGRGGGSQGEKKSDILLAIVNSGYDFGQTPGGDLYAVAKEGAGPYVARMIGKKGGGQLRDELSAKYAAREDSAPDDQTIRSVMNVARGRAMNAEPAELGLRVARHEDGTVIDMGGRSGRAIVLRPGAWEIAPRSPVLFRRTKLTQALPEPVFGPMTLDDLRPLVPLEDETMWPVLVAWEVFLTLRPDEPAPALNIGGEPGAAKTSATRALARLVDPTYPQTRGRPKSEDDWRVAAKGSRVVAIDNLYGIADWLQGGMCRAITGEGDVKRELYSDDELAVMAYRRVLLFNGVAIVGIRDDLADRTILLRIPRMNPLDRLRDRETANAFETAWPALLGGLLDLAVKVLEELPKVKKPVDGWTRMADFEEVLLATDVVLGSDGFGTYRKARESLAEEVILDNVFSASLLAYVNRADVATGKPTGSWQGTCTALLLALTDSLPDPLRPPKGWPSSGRSVSAMLTGIAESFRKIGYEVQYLGHTGPTRDRTWRIVFSGDPDEIAGREEPEENPFAAESDDDDAIEFDVTDTKLRGQRKLKKG